MANSGTTIPAIPPTYFTDAGAPAAGYKLFTYQAGSSTKLATYTDVGLTVANANPIVLDAAGRATIFLSPASYKFVFTSPTDTDPPTSPIWTRDNVSAIPVTNVDLDIPGTAGEDLSAGNVVYLSAGDGGNSAGRWYKADADLTYASTTANAIGMMPADLASGVSGSIRLIGRMTGLSGLTAGTLYYVSATAGALTSSAPTNARPVAVADSTTSVVLSQWIPVPTATATLAGIVSLGTQALGTGTKTVDGLAVNSTPNYKPGGDAALDALASGVLTPSVDSVQHANSGTGETDLSSYSLPASTLSANTKALRIIFWGTLAANGNTKTLRVKFGATSFTGYASTGNGVPYYGMAIVQRTGAATQKVTVFVQTSGGTSTGASGTAAETLSGAVTIKTTGQSGTASSDILQENFFVETLG